jgi:hypothetical protein
MEVCFSSNLLSTTNFYNKAYSQQGQQNDRKVCLKIISAKSRKYQGSPLLDIIPMLIRREGRVITALQFNEFKQMDSKIYRGRRSVERCSY